MNKKEKLKPIKEYIFKIGLDVATKTTGSAVFINGTLASFGDIISQNKLTFCGEKIMEDSIYIKKIITGLISALKGKVEELEEIADGELLEIKSVWHIVLENSTHGQKSVAQKLSTYTGIYSANLTTAIALLFPTNREINLKLINAREWQQRAFGRAMEREDGKNYSIEQAEAIIKKDWPENDEIITDDTADAILMAKHAEILRDNLFVGQQRQERFKAQKSNKQSQINAVIQVNKLLEILRQKQHKSILKIQNLKQSEKIKIERTKIETEKPLIKFATAEQILKINKYKEIFKNNQEQLKLINQFAIKKEY